jgi:hypothetical protein
MKPCVSSRALVLGLLGSATLLLHSCAFFGTVDFSIRFRTPGGQVLNCAQAELMSFKFEFYDEALNNQLRTSVERLCDLQSAEDRFRVSMDLGRYLVRVRGFDPRRVVCYQGDFALRVNAGKTELYDLTADPTGADCHYPS